MRLSIHHMQQFNLALNLVSLGKNPDYVRPISKELILLPLLDKGSNLYLFQCLVNISIKSEI